MAKTVNAPSGGFAASAATNTLNGAVYGTTVSPPVVVTLALNADGSHGSRTGASG